MMTGSGGAKEILTGQILSALESQIDERTRLAHRFGVAATTAGIIAMAAIMAETPAYIGLALAIVGACAWSWWIE